jgi:hypothetical protein
MTNQKAVGVQAGIVVEVEAATAAIAEVAIEDGKNLFNDSQGRDPIAPLFLIPCARDS